jgi:hypothetical protein
MSSVDNGDLSECDGRGVRRSSEREEGCFGGVDRWMLVEDDWLCDCVERGEVEDEGSFISVLIMGGT